MMLESFREHIAKAREAFAAACASYGIVRKVNLISARHHLKTARMTINALREWQEVAA